MSARKQGQIAREKKYIINVNNTLDIQENNTIRDLIPTTSESSDLGSYSNYWRNAYIQDISARNISVSGNIIPFINLSGSLGTTNNIWQKAFISDLSGISSINGMNWSSIISGGGGTSDFNGTDITTDLIPRNPISVDLGTTSKYWRNAYITNISASNISVSGTITLPTTTSILSNNFTVTSTQLGYLSDATRSIQTQINELSNNKANLNFTYNILDTSANSGWIEHGTWTTQQNGQSLFMTLVAKFGYNVEVGQVQNQVTYLNFKTSNGSGGVFLGDGLAWRVSSLGTNISSPSIIRIKQNSSVSYTIFAKYETYTGGSFYMMNIGGATSWVHKNSFSISQPTGTFIDIIPSSAFGTSDFTASNISTSLIPNNPNSIDLGTSSKYWRNAYIQDISARNISISGNIIFNVSGGSMKIAADASNNSITTTHRVYQEISVDISWSAVNGYYALAKDAYPALNPYSSGAKALSKWTSRAVNNNIRWHGICWSPELRIFVATSDHSTNDNRLMWSHDGITWVSVPVELNFWRSVCWSPKHKIFVAVAAGGNTINRVMISSDGKTWIPKPLSGNNLNNKWYRVIWCPELEIFVAISIGFNTTNNTSRVMYSSSSDASTWNSIDLGSTLGALEWYGICWSPELGMFVAVAENGTTINKVMTSNNGIIWDSQSASSNNNWVAVSWSSDLGLFVAVAWNGNSQRIMTSDNGKTWISITQSFTYLCQLWNVCWCSELKLFVAIGSYSATTHTYALMTSSNGKIWNQISVGNVSSWGNICWSPELGIFVIIAFTGATRLMTSSLQGRPPTSYNVFDSSFNSIDESGNWTFSNISVSGNIIPLFPNTGSIGLDTKQWGNIHTVALKVDGVSVSSDDRKKHNEVIITNGLTIINQLTPKFYQKTLEMLDARYNGDLTGYVWNYESGLIAQELLHINDLSFVVSDGDYYDSNNVLIEKQYSVNYNSIFVYGLAAIKELDVKVKNQESIINSLLTIIEALDVKVKNQESIINSLLTRIEALENKP